MTSNDDKRQDRKLHKLASSILKRDTDWLEVKGYKLGDIQTEQNVKVTEKAAVVGNVFAPKVTVSGIIYGFVASREVIIESTGQIWGDIHSVNLTVTPGGKLHGWMSTLDEGTVDLLRSGDLSKFDLEESGRRSIPEEILDILPGELLSSDGSEAEPRLLIWRQLRAEAARAILARSEIEITFERRLMDMVNSSSTISDNEQELLRMRDEQLANLRMALVEREVELKEAQEKSIQLAEQLKQTRRLATKRIRRLEAELEQKR